MTISSQRVKIFLPNSRILSEDEIVSLAAQEKTERTIGRKGLWIEVECPDASCIDKKGNITIPAEGAAQAAQKEKGFWLKLFCPGDSCEITRPTDLP